LDGDWGWSATFTEGAYNGKDFEAQGAKLNSMSSLRVKDGDDCKVTVYEEDDFAGGATSFPEGNWDGEAFAEYACNNAVSSIKVEGRNCVGTLYGGRNFEFNGPDDWQADFKEGEYSGEDFTGHDGVPNEGNSLRVWRVS
jgi:hypothetical protein